MANDLLQSCGRINLKLLKFPQLQKSQDLIQISRRQDNPRYGCTTGPLAGVQVWMSFNLCPDVRRSVEKYPIIAIRADSNLQLATTLALKSPFPKRATI